MGHFKRVFFLGMAMAAALTAQTRAGGACPYLTVEDAGTVLGSGVQAEPLPKTGTDEVCRFQAGGKRLVMTSSKATKMTAYFKEQLAALKAEHKGRDEAGLGDSAISYVDDGSAVIMALKGDQTYSLQAFDAGTSPAVFEKLRSLMRKGMGK